MINIKEISKNSKKPEIYTKGSANMWTDNHISKFLLEAHIDLDHDLASRNIGNINRVVDWLMELSPKKSMEVLDLGCGPGLYCESIARKGHKVTGIDFSSRSIEYAQKSSEKKGLKIEYSLLNYLEIDYVDRFDMIVIIYCDFGALVPEEQKLLLRKIYRALKPGGFFIFDAIHHEIRKTEPLKKDWEAVDHGFWKPNPYILLSQSFTYEGQKVLLDQYTVVDETGNHETYRFWNHCFNNTEVMELLTLHGFSNIRNCRNLTGARLPLMWNREVVFYKGEKPE